MPTTNEELKRLLDRVLDTTQDGFKETNESFGHHNDRLSKVEANLDRIVHLVDGNGKPPLAARLATLEEGQNELKKDVGVLEDQRRRSSEKWIERMWTIIQPIIIAVISSAITAGAISATAMKP